MIELASLIKLSRGLLHKTLNRRKLRLFLTWVFSCVKVNGRIVLTRVLTRVFSGKKFYAIGPRLFQARMEDIIGLYLSQSVWNFGIDNLSLCQLCQVMQSSKGCIERCITRKSYFYSLPWKRAVHSKMSGPITVPKILKTFCLLHLMVRGLTEMFTICPYAMFFFLILSLTTLSMQTQYECM